MIPPVTTAQEVREASSPPQDSSVLNQVGASGNLEMYKAVHRTHVGIMSESVLLGPYTQGGVAMPASAPCIIRGQLQWQVPETSADDEALQLVLKRLKALEQENEVPERRELLRRRKKQLREILIQHRDSPASSQLLALQGRFEQEVSD